MKPLILTRTEARRAAAGTLGAVLRKIQFTDSWPPIIAIEPNGPHYWKGVAQSPAVMQQFSSTWPMQVKPHYAPGDRVPCKERFALIGEMRPIGYFRDPKWIDRVAWYESDNDRPMWGGSCWQPGQRMPAIAVRRHFTVSAVRPVRLGDCPQDAQDDYNATHGPGSYERDKGLWFWLIEGKVER